MNRRAFLATMSLLAVVRGGEARNGSKDEAAAMRRLAQSPGPAREKLTMITPRHPPQPLPFGLHDVPGLSRDTHYVHYERHYLEYLWRWEDGDRQLLQLASEGAPPEQLQSLDESRRAAANMVLLHHLYWRNLGTELRPSDDRLSGITDKFLQLPPHIGGTPTQWLLLVQDAVGPRTQLLAAPAPSHRVVAAVDLADHAWVLDFPDLRSYLRHLPRLWLKHLDQWELALEYDDGPLSTEPPLPAEARSFREGLQELANALGVSVELDTACRTLRRAAGEAGGVCLVRTEDYPGVLDIQLGHCFSPASLTNARVEIVLGCGS